MYASSRKQRGFLLTEVVVAVGVLALLMAGFAMCLHEFAAFNRYQLARQHCTAAAQAQLDSIWATGSPLDEEQSKRLWPDVVVSLREGVGSGQWRGTKLVEAEAVERIGERAVRVKLQRYIAARPEK
jgi:hypothetical protein